MKMKRKISLLLVVVLITLQFLPGYSPVNVHAEETKRELLYNGDIAQISVETAPLKKIEEETDLSVGKYLKLMISLNGEAVETQIFQYEQDPGITDITVQENYGTESIKLDNEEFVSGSEFVFLRENENQIRTLDVSLYTKAELTVHYQDEEGNVLREDSVIGGKLNDTITLEKTEIEGYEQCTEENSVLLDASEKEIIILYRKMEELKPGAEASIASDEIIANYEPGYEMNIEGKNIRFVIQTPPEKNGTLIVKLPAFFELTSIPTSTAEYEVDTTEEIIEEDDEELGKLLAGEKRQVITFRYKEVTSAVNISFEMKQMKTKPLTQAMIRAGEHPDQVPLNVDISLYNEEKNLLNETCIKGSSELSKENELEIKNSGGESTYQEEFDKGSNTDFGRKNLLYLWGQSSKINVSPFHYPYTNIELLIPYDREEKMESFNYGDRNRLADWEEIRTETYNDIKYFVGGYNKKKDGSSEEYNANIHEDAGHIRLIFGNDVESKETLIFDHPVLLRYTYKGKTEVKELYKLPSYTFPENFLPQIGWVGFDSTSRDVLCGEEVGADFGINNYQENKLPLDRENLILTLDYPYEVQPKEITSLYCGEKRTFDIKYTVVNSETGEERVVEEEKVSSGYQFLLQDKEYVSRIEIQIPEMKKKEAFRFDTKNLTQTKDKEGNSIDAEKTVPIIGELWMEEERISTGTYYINLKPLEDNLYVRSKSVDEAFLEEDDDVSYSVGQIKLGAEDERFAKDYEEVIFKLNAPKEVMSKIIGYQIHEDDGNEIEGDVVISYDTNLKKNQFVIRTDNRDITYLELEKGEYVTNISIKMEKIVAKRMSEYDSNFLAPIIDTKRTYYDDSGEKKEVSFDHKYEISYDFSTSSPPAKNMTKEELTTYVEYKNHVEFPLYGKAISEISMENSDGFDISSGYRGNIVIANVPGLIEGPISLEYYNRFKKGREDEEIEFNQKYYYKNQFVYLEVNPGFEILKLTVPSTLVRKERLENGNNLFVFQVLSDSLYPARIKAEVYIRPDAKIESCYPIAGVGISLDEYFKEFFPDYPDCEKEKDSFPYQIVKLYNEKYKSFPVEWNLSDREKEYGVYSGLSGQDGSGNFTVRNVTTSTTTMLGEVAGSLKSGEIDFKEKQRENLGFAAFISASSNETLKDYTATFVIPEEGDKVEGANNKKYEAKYSLYGNGAMEIYLNGQPVNLSEKGISIIYYDQDGNKVTVSDETNWKEVRKIKVHFGSLDHENVYEIRMPLSTDVKAGEDTSDWKSYIGTYNQTGNGAIVYNNPVTYVYQSYSINSTFGLDKTEQGNNANLLPVSHMLTIFDKEWNPIFTKEIKAEDSENVSIQEKFNAGGKELGYVGFSLENKEAKKYLPTLRGNISDISDEKIHKFSDGTKVWYLPIDEKKFITDSTEGNYDALFIRKPEITANDINVAVGEEGKLDFSVNQPADKDIIKKYQISVRLLDDDTDAKDIAGIIQADANGDYHVKGLKKGTVPYEVTVTNTQGTSFTAKADITVGDKLYKLLPHVGGTGAKGFALAGLLLIAGGSTVVFSKKKIHR